MSRCSGPRAAFAGSEASGDAPARRTGSNDAHSYNRAVAGELDLLVLEGMSFYGYHGETEAERVLGTHFFVDAEIRIDLSRAGASDHIADTLDYAHAFTLVREVVEGQRYRLIEAVAEHVARCLLAEPRVASVKVKVGKRPPIAGSIERCSVVIERHAGSPA